VVANVRESVSVRKREKQEDLNFKKPKNAEIKQKYQPTILNRFVALEKAWESELVGLVLKLICLYEFLYIHTPTVMYEREGKCDWRRI
jgi:hypothetical protein